MRIDQLEAENRRLKDRLRYQERAAKEGPFGSSTPSAKIPIKPSSPSEQTQRQGGAQPGHRGHGRRAPVQEQITRWEVLPTPNPCPYCGGRMDPKGSKERTVIDVEPVRKEVIRYELEQRDCSHCQRTITARTPGVFAKGLFGNQLLAHVAIEHFLHGITLGHLSRQLKVNDGSLCSALHQLAARLAPAQEQLLREYQRAPVKHADETSWRTDGRNGYAWLFCTRTLSLFRFRGTRAASVPQEVFGTKRLRGLLIVDRYNGYNQTPCALQYCYAHLLRDVQDLQKDFPEAPEVLRFVATFAPLLAAAIQLRAQSLSLPEFNQKALELKLEIKTQVFAEAQHPGIQKIQNIFRDKPHRFYHWAKNPSIPADNNQAERDLRQLVIARKISFGSQSEKGARTRETLMSILHTLSKRTADVFDTFRGALDRLAEDEKRDPYEALFDSS